jgi:hypothetical protein
MDLADVLRGIVFPMEAANGVYRHPETAAKLPAALGERRFTAQLAEMKTRIRDREDEFAGNWAVFELAKTVS